MADYYLIKCIYSSIYIYQELFNYSSVPTKYVTYFKSHLFEVLLI